MFLPPAVVVKVLPLIDNKCRVALSEHYKYVIEKPWPEEMNDLHVFTDWVKYRLGPEDCDTDEEDCDTDEEDPIYNWSCMVHYGKRWVDDILYFGFNDEAVALLFNLAF